MDLIRLALFIAVCCQAVLSQQPTTVQLECITNASSNATLECGAEIVGDILQGLQDPIPIFPLPCVSFDCFIQFTAIYESCDYGGNIFICAGNTDGTGDGTGVTLFPPNFRQQSSGEQTACIEVQLNIRASEISEACAVESSTPSSSSRVARDGTMEKTMRNQGFAGPTGFYCVDNNRTGPCPDLYRSIYDGCGYVCDNSVGLHAVPVIVFISALITMLF